MTRDEARRLLGGYATGSLTEAERAALMAATLDDQELFEELAGEQELKEILDQPGVRERLIQALDRRPAGAWWWRPWPWATAAGTLAIAIMIVVMQRTPAPPPQEIAQVVKPAEPVKTAEPVSPVKAADAPKALQRVEAPAPVAAPAAPPPPPVDAIEEARADQARAKPQAAGGVSAFSAVRQAEPLALNAVRQFGLGYAVRADGILEMAPASMGFLSVTAGTNVLYPSTSVAAGATIRVQIPAEAASLSIGFYRMQGSAATPVRRAELTGTVTDQDPPNGRIAIELSLKPATQ